LALIGIYLDDELSCVPDDAALQAYYNKIYLEELHKLLLKWQQEKADRANVSPSLQSPVLEPEEPLVVLKPAETLAVLEPAESLAALEPAVPLAAVEQADPLAFLEPLELTLELSNSS
jgi:hypothetical protein